MTLAWSERKPAADRLCHGRIKAWEIDCVKPFMSRAFSCYAATRSENKGEFAMNKTWLSVIAAAIFEVGWVIGLKHAGNGWEWGGTAIAIFISFYLMIAASRSLPVGTVYAVFVGLGTAGTVLAEILLFGAEVRILQMALIGLLLVGVIGLKWLSQEKQEGVKDA